MGVVWCDMMWYGVVSCGMVWCGVVCCGVRWSAVYDMRCRSMVWCGGVMHGTDCIVSRIIGSNPVMCLLG